MQIPIISKWVIKKRIRYASRMGALEHRFGRLIAIPILSGGLFNYAVFKEDLVVTTYWLNTINLILFGLTFICWAIYLISHTCEKGLYSSYGPRG